MTRGRLIRGGVVLAGGQASGQVLAFARGAVVARLLGPEQSGAAAVILVATALLDMASYLGIDVLLVQAPDGDEPHVQRTAQAVQGVRGVLLALLVAAIAGPAARAFGVPSAAGAFALIGLSPLISGFAHLDVKRVQRRMSFAPDMGVEAMAQLVATIAAWPVLALTRDCSAVVWLAIIKALVSTIGSHAAAQRAYRWTWNRGQVSRIACFGWPLLLNGLLIYGMMQGDQLAIGLGYAPRELGVYAGAATLAIGPAALIARTASSLALPALAAVQDDDAALGSRSAACAEWLALAGVLAFAPMVVMSREIVALVYGAKFAGAAAVLPWLAAAQALRVVRLAPTMAAMARGDTATPLMANVMRGTALVAVGIAAWWRMPLQAIGACGVAGEIAALLVCVARVRTLRLGPMDCLIPAGYVVAALAPGLVLPVGREGETVLRTGLVACVGAWGFVAARRMWRMHSAGLRQVHRGATVTAHGVKSASAAAERAVSAEVVRMRELEAA